jgi:peptidoglycan-associated lipoprotein
MKAVSWTRCGLFGIAVGVLGACAHEKPPPVAETPPPPKQEAPVAQSEPPAAKPKWNEEIDGVLKATVVHFDFNKDVIKPEGKDTLVNLGGVLLRNPDVIIQIQGNCDERGTEEYNLHLGMRRASSAKQYLVGLGVGANRIDTISYGFERPVDPNHNEKAWALNRRDDFVRTQDISTR